MVREYRTQSRNDLLFEALIKQGCSAEKAARVACADADAPDPLKEKHPQSQGRRASWL